MNCITKNKNYLIKRNELFQESRLGLKNNSCKKIIYRIAVWKYKCHLISLSKLNLQFVILILKECNKSIILCG